MSKKNFCESCFLYKKKRFWCSDSQLKPTNFQHWLSPPGASQTMNCLASGSFQGDAVTCVPWCKPQKMVCVFFQTCFFQPAIRLLWLVVGGWW